MKTVRLPENKDVKSCTTEADCDGFSEGKANLTIKQSPKADPILSENLGGKLTASYLSPLCPSHCKSAINIVLLLNCIWVKI